MDETMRLTSLIDDFLDISKMESEMDSLNVSEYNLTQSIKETCDTMNKLLKKDGFEISFSYDKDVYVEADKAKINRVFYNFLTNAVNYSGENKLISVKQEIFGETGEKLSDKVGAKAGHKSDDMTKQKVRISVTDNGVGIADDVLPFVWDRYYKSGKPHQRAITGSGLGLSIVKKIIEMHGGAYGVSSEPGVGSTFWFELDVE
jgi:signal transduction histidine kinase